MATTIAPTQTYHHHPPKPKSSSSTAAGNLQVCFSFAAYAKKLIDHLKFLHIPILPGLTDSEFCDIESKFKFSFPPDLRSILQEGLPFGPNFPNWRSSFLQQLQILHNLPALNLSNNIRIHEFWVESWGPRPGDRYKLDAVFKKLLDNAPALVPIYQNCYIPAFPAAAGNPVFYVDEEVVRVLSFDIAGFFQQLEKLQLTGNDVLVRNENNVRITLPAWAATTAREIEFWTETAKKGKRKVASADSREATDGWWIPEGGEGGGFEICCELKLSTCMEEMFWRLRDGGWREEEVREMMMMMNGCDRLDRKGRSRMGNEKAAKEENPVWHVKVISAGELLRAGWSREDVLYSLDLQDCDQDMVFPTVVKESSAAAAATFDFHIANGCWRQGGNDRQRRNRLRDFMNLHSFEV